MSTSQYMSGRRKYGRPQAILWSEYEPVIQDGMYVPQGFEVGQRTDSINEELLDSFIILSDDNRDKLDFSFERIEKRERMINGRMRSYHVADKLSLNTSWSALPSRSFSAVPGFNDDGSPSNLVTSVNHDLDPGTPDIEIGYSGSPHYQDQQYTTDGGAGGAEMLRWYENHPGPFWVYLAYDKYTNFEGEDIYSKLSQYNEAIEMYITDFSYSVSKRGRSNFDLWDISVTLEEV